MRVLVYLILLAGGVAVAADAQTLKHYDDPLSFASQGDTMSKDEVLAFLKFHAKDMQLKEFQDAVSKLKSTDDNFAKSLADAEAKANADSTNTVLYDYNYRIVNDKYGHNTNAPGGRFNTDGVRLAILDTKKAAIPPKPEKKPDPNEPSVQVFVRRNGDILNNNFSATSTDAFTTTETSGQQTTKSSETTTTQNGALFSYARNLNTARDTFTAEGSVSPAIHLTPDTEIGLQDLWAVPSLDFQHLNGSNVKTTNRLDSLSLGAGGFADFVAGDYQSLIRMDEYSQTDFDLRSFLQGGDLQYEMQTEKWYFGNLGHWIRPWQLPETHRDVILLMPRVALDLDGGHIFDAGNKTTIKSGDDYLRSGARITLDICPGDAWEGVWTENVLLKSKLQFFYGHYAGLVGHAYNDFGANLHIGLDNKGIFGVDATFEDGGLNANGDKAKQFTVGISIKE